MKQLFTFIIGMLMCGVAAQAASPEKYDKWGTHNSNGTQVRLNLGYAVGGTTPLPLPAEIRSINRFMPYGGGNLGVDATRMFGNYKKRVGISGGLHGFVHGMKTGAEVKGYYMGLRMGNDAMEGYFTGVDETNVRLMGLTMPVKLVWRANHRWTIEAGPYLQLFLKKEFEGRVYDGYLRKDTPTGEKVDISGGAEANYDFSSDMRPANYGVEMTFDWKATRHVSLYGTVDWGMNGIFNHDFKTVAFKMYSVYANIGVAYSIF